MVRHWFYGVILNTCITASYAQQPSEPENIIESVSIDQQTVKVTINKSFKEKWLKEDFFACYQPDINLKEMPLSIVLLPFILNICPAIWVSKTSYTIDSMDEDTYYSLEKIKKVLERLYPLTSFEGNLIPKTVVKTVPTTPLLASKDHIAILFSNGLDSTACSFQHSDKHQLLISAQGQPGLSVYNDKLWKKRRAKFTQYAKDYGYQNAFVKANFSEFLNWEALENVSPEITSWRVDTSEGIGLFGVAAPILFAKGYPTLLIGSSFTWDYPYLSAANPFIDNSLKAAHSFCLQHEHFNLSRFDKVKLIVDLVKQKNMKIPYLVVCDNRPGVVNCSSHCAKCQTVVNSLFALGEDPTSYGFTICAREVEGRTKSYFEKKQGHWTCWNFCDLQDKLRQLPEVPKKLRWILDYNFMKNASYCLAGAKSRANWCALSDLAPESVVIPEPSQVKAYDNIREKRKQEKKRRRYIKVLRAEKNPQCVSQDSKNDSHKEISKDLPQSLPQEPLKEVKEETKSLIEKAYSPLKNFLLWINSSVV